jgi:uncharacterized protein (DUF433 family)
MGRRIPCLPGCVMPTIKASMQARNTDSGPPTGLLVPTRTEGYPRCMAWQGIITLEPGKRGDRPCVRGMRITVADVLGWLAVGMTHEEIHSDYSLRSPAQSDLAAMRKPVSRHR